MILWGPPGTGKTTIARLLAERVQLHFEQLSAVFSGVADLQEGVRGGRAAPAQAGAGHAAVRRRDPPLQPRPAGRLPARRRGRHRHPGRRHHREPLLRTERRAAVALPGAGAAPAGRRRAGKPAGPRRGRARRARCRWTPEARAALRAMADGDGRYLLNLAEEIVRAARRQAARPGRRWRRRCSGARRSTTRTGKSTTT